MIKVERTKGQAGRLRGSQRPLEQRRKVTCKRAGLGEGAEESGKEGAVWREEGMAQ